ncbi:MAG: hypothetical protein NTW25_14370 [Candidatus Kapabacteria bacterium]|nr:hypothetical protein [Candidatus Kapabacteria bacterium]
MKKIILIILILNCLSACHFPIYETFYLNRGIPDAITISGNRLKNIDSIIKPSKYENVLILKPGALVSLKTSKLTQFTADFTIKLLKGDGLNFYFRTTDKDFDKNKCLRFEVTKIGCKLFDNNNQIGYYASSKIEENEKFRIKIINNGKLANVFFDCAELLKHKTNLSLTEYVIIESINSTTVELSGIDFAQNK